MTKLGSMWRRGFVLAASVALLVAAVPATTIAQEEETLEPVNIMHYFTPEFGEAAFLGLLGDYMTETGRQVNINLVPHEGFKVAILTQLAGGNPPDFFSDWAGARAQLKADNGMLADIGDMWEANDLDSAFPAGMIDMVADFDGIKHEVPLNYHVAAMWYSPSIFEAAGVAVPTTWDELKGACEALKGAGVVPFALGSGQSWTAQFWFDYILLRTAGAEYRAKLMAGDASYTDPEVIRTMELWAELVTAGCFNEDANAKTYTDAADMVANGEAAMTLMGTWITGYWTPEENPLEPLVDYDLFEFPVIDEGVPTAVVGPVDALTASAGAKNLEGAKDLLAFFARPEVQAGWAAGQGALPANLASDPPDNPTMAKALELAGAETYNFNYDLATPGGPATVGLAMFQEFMNDPSDVAGLMERTQNSMAEAFANE